MKIKEVPSGTHQCNICNSTPKIEALRSLEGLGVTVSCKCETIRFKLNAMELMSMYHDKKTEKIKALKSFLNSLKRKTKESRNHGYLINDKYALRLGYGTLHEVVEKDRKLNEINIECLDISRLNQIVTSISITFTQGVWNKIVDMSAELKDLRAALK